MDPNPGNQLESHQTGDDWQRLTGPTMNRFRAERGAVHRRKFDPQVTFVHWGQHLLSPFWIPSRRHAMRSPKQVEQINGIKWVGLVKPTQLAVANALISSAPMIDGIYPCKK